MKNKFELRYSPEFLKDFEGINFYIKHELNNIIAAENLLNKVEEKIKERRENPLGYEEYKTKANNIYYRIYIDNYIVFYTVNGTTMEIRRIIYGRRNFDKLI